jgi:nucleotide-binding universal stress UspA family protein
MTVLAGFIPTPEGQAAFAAALDEAQRRGEDLVVLNSPRSGAPVSADVAAPALIEDLRARAKAAGVKADVRQGGHVGDAADEVLRVAEELNASVIVIGLRRRSPVGKFLLGSNAQRVLLGADRPVLAVKPDSGA